MAVRLPNARRLEADREWRLVEAGDGTKSIPVFLGPAVGADGSRAKEGGIVMGTLPARAGTTSVREFRLEAAARDASKAAAFRFADVSEKSLGLWEGDRRVFVYNHGVMSKSGVPANRNRSTYLHPLFGDRKSVV